MILETDGKLMSGRDIAIAALLGAEEFGFATAPLVTMGCRMMRVCNLDTCPFGIATQNQELRKRFRGKPEYVMNFMLFMAENLREIMAQLGFRTVEEMVGHSECLQVRAGDDHGLQLDKIIGQPCWQHALESDAFDFELDSTVDVDVLLPEFKPYMKKKPVFHEATVQVTSTDRTVGTILGSEITRKYRQSLKDDTFVVNCLGGAGQSFGAFIPRGLTLRLSGDANDYFGKGLSGGRLIVAPEAESTLVPEDNVIIGNVALYGATSGQAFIRGKAGERFCVRNSGAEAVAEGCGDHGLEYMTGGTVVILGKTGKNFAAGMSGGIAFVLDRSHTLYRRLNQELVSMEEVESKTDRELLQRLLTQHVQATGSELAAGILADFEGNLKNFKKIIPNDYKKIKTVMKEYEDKGYSPEEAELMAFDAIHAGNGEEKH